MIYYLCCYMPLFLIKLNLLFKSKINSRIKFRSNTKLRLSLMNTLLQYDLLRLEAFQNNHTVRDSIAISKEGELTLLKFKLVNYFNYCIGKIESPQVLDLIRSFYSDTVEKQHQILIDAEDQISHAIVRECSDYRFFKKIAVMRLKPQESFRDYTHPKLQLRQVTEANIREFAWLYLQCFEAENRHKESVEENFLYKFRVDGVKFYFIQWNNLPIGITGLYQNDEVQILSVGAVKEEFRNLGFHKAALSWRIQTCRNFRPDLPIYSWAYLHSISQENMLKSGMNLAQELLVYQHVG